MNLKSIPQLKIGDFVAKIPIVQGGMGVGISLSGLASAVANEGGIGVIAAAGIGMLEPDFIKNFKEANRRALRKEIQKAREKTDGIIGVNIMVALSDFEELLLVAIDEKVDLVFMGAGLPLLNPNRLTPEMIKNSSTKFVVIVSSAKAARVIFRYWENNYNLIPDAVVVEGPMAGGHLGFKKENLNDPDYKLEKIVPEVISEIKIYEDKFEKNVPVIAAGGIFNGADIHKFIQLGASGVQMATRFVATFECDASDEFKQEYLKCKKDDIVIIDSPVGLPGRAIKNNFINEVYEGIKRPFKCPWKCLATCDFKKVPYCIALALTNAKNGKLTQGFTFCGANAYLVDRIVSVKELIRDLVDGYEKVQNSIVELISYN
ncbi:MAG: nitronate monooxygenase [candidate division WOR-3 bacterium]